MLNDGVTENVGGLFTTFKMTSAVINVFNQKGESCAGITNKI